MHFLKKFIKYYKPYKSVFFIDMFCALLASAIDLAFPSNFELSDQEPVYRITGWNSAGAVGNRPEYDSDVSCPLRMPVLYYLLGSYNGSKDGKRYETGSLRPLSKAFFFIL